MSLYVHVSSWGQTRLCSAFCFCFPSINKDLFCSLCNATFVLPFVAYFAV